MGTLNRERRSWRSLLKKIMKHGNEYNVRIGIMSVERKSDTNSAEDVTFKSNDVVMEKFKQFKDDLSVSCRIEDLTVVELRDRVNKMLESMGKQYGDFKSNTVPDGCNWPSHIKYTYPNLLKRNELCDVLKANEKDSVHDKIRKFEPRVNISPEQGSKNLQTTSVLHFDILPEPRSRNMQTSTISLVNSNSSRNQSVVVDLCIDDDKNDNQLESASKDVACMAVKSTTISEKMMKQLVTSDVSWTL